MEAPVFLVMCWMWIHSERRFDPVILTFFVFFQIHYFQRAFVFPLLLTGKSKMPLAIMSMGILFNLLNGYMQGEWIFYLSPEGMYHSGWFTSAWFIAGSLLFFAGMLMNWHSDYIIRHLRKPGIPVIICHKKGCTAMSLPPIIWAKSLNGQAGQY